MQHDIITNTVAEHGRDVFDVVTLLVGIAGLFILGRYTHHSRKQKEAAESANKLARRHNELSARAWLLATGAGSEQIRVGMNQIAVMIEYSGVAPATDIVVKSLYGWGQGQELPAEWHEAHHGDVRGALGGSAGIQIVHFLNFQAEEFRTINTGALWLRCEIEYSDCFRRRKPTIAIWRYNPTNHKWAVVRHDVDQGPQEDELT